MAVLGLALDQAMPDPRCPASLVTRLGQCLEAAELALEAVQAAQAASAKEEAEQEAAQKAGPS